MRALVASKRGDPEDIANAVGETLRRAGFDVELLPAPDTRGFPATVMAKPRAGWRNPEHIRAWASEVAQDLPTALPRATIAPPGSSAWRVALHAFFGWAACAVTMGLLLTVAGPGTALVVHALVTPFIFAVVAQHYFRRAGACEPLSTATAFVTIVALLDLIFVAGLIQHSVDMFRSVMGSWLPFLLLFSVTWGTGEVMLVLPGPAQSLPSTSK